MDDISFSKKANISVINRFDQQVQDIVISASQVALYVFEKKKSRWVKRKTEGACFFYKRKTSPKYGIFILNRLDTNNFIELLNSTMEFELEAPFILYRNIFQTIYGIWFYDPAECTAMANVFHSVLTELKQKEAEDIDEENVMTKDKLCTANIGTNGTANKTPKSQAQPDSVRQFFASASKEATKIQPLTSQQKPSAGKSLCNSFQSVALIEKAHQNPDRRPQSAFRSYPNDHVASSMADNSNVNVLNMNIKTLNLGPSVQEVERFPNNFILKTESTAVRADMPELIPPEMLLTPSDLSASVKPEVKDNSGVNKTLSKTQMIQAMEYLLKHDADFTNKLYDAYLKTTQSN